MTPLSAFHSRLLPLVPGCPHPMMDQALLDSAIEFCEESLAVRERVPTFSTMQGQQEYELDMDAGVSLVQVLRVTVGGAQVPLATSDAAMAQSAEQVGAPRLAYVSPLGELVLHPTPDAGLSVGVDVATKPSRTAKSVAGVLFERWADTVVFGAAKRICAVPGQPFSSPAASDFYARQARAGTQAARVATSYGRVRGSSWVSPRAFA